MRNVEPNELTAAEAAAAIAAGEIASEALVQSCLERIAAREDDVQAWQHLDPELALFQARIADQLLEESGARSPLHGVPVAIKDIIDTFDMPTENGSARFAGREPEKDAFVVELLRRAGAVILGKSVTTEIAMSSPGKTRHPMDPARTPGGSSSGSCAAVGDKMAPLALGSQTSGSTIRPASFNSIYGYKPTFGSISCTGVNPLSRDLDHVGLLGRSVEDLALLGDVLMVHDEADEMMLAEPERNLVAALGRPLEGTPRLAFSKTPYWDEAEEGAQVAMSEFVVGLGDVVTEIDLPDGFERMIAHHTAVIGAGLARFYAEEVACDPPVMTENTRARISDGCTVLAGDYLRGLDARDAMLDKMVGVFAEYDAILVPAAAGEAPVGLAATGKPVFNAPWTLLGTPAVTLPLLSGPNRLPLGGQLVAAKGEDAKLLQTAKWLVAHLAG